MLSNFRLQTFVAVFGDFGEKVPVVDNVLSSHEHKIYPTISHDDKCIEFEFQTDRNFKRMNFRANYVDLRQTYLALELKIVKVRGYETYNITEV